MKNIADDPANARIISKLRRQLKKLQKQVGDKLDLDSASKS